MSGTPKWQVIESEAENAEGESHMFVNVVPMCGDEHELSPSCWCGPLHDPEEWHVIIHKLNFTVVR